LRAFRTALLLAGCALVLWVNDQNWVVAWPWFAPAGLVIAFLFGWGLAVPRRA
jgi:hypothetical protein